MASPRIDVGMYVPAKPPIADIERAVRAAQHGGLDSLFVWDHVVDFFPQALWNDDFTWTSRASTSPHEWFDYQTLLGYIAAKATGVRLGVGVTEPLRRHPLLLAQAILTLSHLSARPPILGIGSGEPMNTEPYGLDFSHSVSKLEEALQVLRLAFTAQGPITFEGAHYQLRDALLDLPPAAGNTPEIWVAAHGPRMLELTGRYADGWYPFAVASPEDYAARLAIIHAAAREAGRDPAAITPAFHAIMIVAPTEQEARALLAAPAVRFWGLLFPDAIWQLFGLDHPFGRGFRGYLGAWPLLKNQATWEAAIAKVPAALVESLLWGTPDQLTAKLRAFGDAGLRHVVPIFVSAAVSEEAARFSSEALREITRALASEHGQPATVALMS
jgi:phthiodiolone/phenolphthiodiolone dimycocerosates ketoreductase